MVWYRILDTAISVPVKLRRNAPVTLSKVEVQCQQEFTRHPAQWQVCSSQDKLSSECIGQMHAGRARGEHTLAPIIECTHNH